MRSIDRRIICSIHVHVHFFHIRRLRDKQHWRNKSRLVFEFLENRTLSLFPVITIYFVSCYELNVRQHLPRDKTDTFLQSSAEPPDNTRQQLRTDIRNIFLKHRVWSAERNFISEKKIRVLYFPVRGRGRAKIPNPAWPSKVASRCSDSLSSVL